MKTVLSCSSAVAFSVRGMTTMRIRRLAPFACVLALAACDGNAPQASKQAMASDALVAAKAQRADRDAKPANSVSQASLSGIVSAWSHGAPQEAAKPASAARAEPAPSAQPPRSEPSPQQVLAQARMHAKASVRILELQAEQDPANAAAYLAQAAQLAARNEPLMPVQRTQPKEVVEYQRKVNAFMSAKIDQLAAAQANQNVALNSAASTAQNTPLRGGDNAGPRPGDIAASKRE